MALDVELVVDEDRVVTADESTEYIECEGGFLAWARLWTGAMSGTNPTCDVRLQYSPDGGSNYYLLGKFQQLVGTNDNARLAIPVYIPHPSSTEQKVRVRANYDVGGTTPSFAISHLILDPIVSLAPLATDEEANEGAAAMLSSL